MSRPCRASQLDADRNGFPEHIVLAEDAACVFLDGWDRPVTRLLEQTVMEGMVAF